jgi:hypothetical protein
VLVLVPHGTGCLKGAWRWQSWRCADPVARPIRSGGRAAGWVNRPVRAGSADG